MASEVWYTVAERSPLRTSGSIARASDIMWREIRRTVESGKPVIASMGNLAASGGYYMAMACDEIVALPTTITGSIGVVTMRLDLAGLYADNQVNVGVVKTHPSADFYSNHRGLTESEIEMFHRRTRESYRLFVAKAAESRGVSFEVLDRVARGRPWSGRDALEAGLIDGLGGLNEAIGRAAEKAGLPSYRVFRYPIRERYFGMWDQDSSPLTHTKALSLLRFVPPELRILADFADRNGQHRPMTLAISPYQPRID